MSPEEGCEDDLRVEHLFCKEKMARPGIVQPEKTRVEEDLIAASQYLKESYNKANEGRP